MMKRIVCLVLPLHSHMLKREPELRKDDLVTIRNCPPISAMKRFKLEQILKSPTTERELVRKTQAPANINVSAS